MLNPAELKITLATLNSRRSWLQKQSTDASQDESKRKEHVEAIKLIDSAMQKLAQSSKAPASSGPNRKKPGLSALVAEDEPTSASILKDLLEDLGFKEIDVATDGVAAFDRIKGSKEPYDVILCDWDMPELNGLEVYQKAKASNTLRGAHFMMVTGVSEASRIREAIEQGIQDYLVKPVDADALEGKIKAALGERFPSGKNASQKKAG